MHFKQIWRLFFLAGSLIFGHTEVSLAQNVKHGEDVIAAMHRAYAGQWYQYLTFQQKTTFYGPDGNVQLVQWWHQALKLPGNLAIKFDSLNSPNGILFTNNLQYGFSDGALIQAHPFVHDVLVLGFDVYHQPVEQSVSQLRSAGYNLDEWYEDEWQGRPVYVVGTSTASPHKNQFWIDKERLVFVRSLKMGRGNSMQETRFNAYEHLGSGWIAPEVMMIVNGQIVMLEEYFSIRIPDVIDEAVFNPQTFLDSAW